MMFMSRFIYVATIENDLGLGIWLAMAALGDREVLMYAIAIPAGRLTIRPGSHDGMGCEVWLNDEHIGTFSSAALAAQTIGQRRSGCLPIDSASVRLPADIEAWQWISVRTPTQ
jgi:hypothetical protein